MHALVIYYSAAASSIIGGGADIHIFVFCVTDLLTDKFVVDK
jgi:hypothetical protein